LLQHGAEILDFLAQSGEFLLDALEFGGCLGGRGPVAGAGHDRQQGGNTHGGNTPAGNHRANPNIHAVLLFPGEPGDRHRC
jgi:hypothetical protein